MTTARDLMTPRPRCIGVNDSLRIAASVMADLDVGALPICGEDGKLKGMLTDRELQLIELLARGCSAAEAAVALRVSERTIRNHRDVLVHRLRAAAMAA